MTEAERTISWGALLRETESMLGDRMHAQWICETATSSTPDEFRAMLDQPAGERAVSHLDAMVARYRTGEPVQYVLGSWGFRRLDLAIDRRVLIPRPETELLAELAVERAATFGPTRAVADLGTGSGAIGLSIADELPIDGTTVWLTDASAEALDVARANLAGLGRAAINVRIGHGSWFEALPDGALFDIIVSNPPYVADDSAELEAIVANWEPSAALLSGPDGLDDITVLVAGANARLNPGGWLLLEHGHDQGRAVRSLMESAGLVKIESKQDFAANDRITLAQRPGLAEAR